MQFTLHYRGLLKANGGPRDKHALRAHFHSQLRELWQQPPLKDYRGLVDGNVGSSRLNLREAVEAFTFVPLVSERIALIAELDIFLLRPGPPGSLITQGGDIDNRIKTLLDALKVPEPNAIPRGTVPTPDQEPFFCLLQDDSLITRLNIDADRLLEPVSTPSEVVLQIRVCTRQLAVYAGTIGLA